MAGHDNGDRIVMVGLAYGAKSQRPTDLSRERGIRARLSVGNAQQRLPAGFLKAGAGQVQLAGEGAQASAKICVYLLLIGLKAFARFDPDFIPPRPGELAVVK